MLGKDLVGFIQSNQLEEVEVCTDWVEGLSFSVFLDKEQLKEIEYNWNYKADDTIIFREWTEENEDGDIHHTDRQLTAEEALEMRGLR